jgi:hypothetical protein
MATIYQYRVFCTTDSKYEYVWGENAPTTCPSNTAHSIDASSITIVDKVDKTEVKIQEENTPTNGNFATATLKLMAIKNTTTSTTERFPYPVSALVVDFVTAQENSGDTVNLIVGKDTITGYITANVSPSSAWTSQNYTSGQTVSYNGRIYTCFLDTVANEVPTNKLYWKHGLRVSVSQTVIDNIYPGYYVKLVDLTNSESDNRVVSVDKVNDYIYIETDLVNSYLASSPTYIKQSVYFMKDYDIGHPWNHDIGNSKIGGSYIPTDVGVTIEYTNFSTTDDKLFIGRVEYLY